jgi:hypothetical protein
MKNKINKINKFNLTNRKDKIMKKLLTFTILFTINIMSAQELSYGVVLGNSFYAIANNNGTNNMEVEDSSIFIIGGYGEYNITDNIGIKTDILYERKSFFYNPIMQPFQMNVVSLAPSFKYDFGKEYREGFYLLIGPKLSFVTSVESEGEDVKDSFETFNFGTQLGFSYRVLTFVDLQTKIEYDVSPFFKLENGRKSNFFGAVFSANIDLAKLFSND